MPVVDASVLVNALVSAGQPGALARAELRELTTLSVPSAFMAEVVSALRSVERRGELSPGRAAAVVRRARAVRTIQYPFEPFAERIWELRFNLSVYDAWYVALAEWLVTRLVTADRSIAAAPGLRCDVRFLG